MDGAAQDEARGEALADLFDDVGRFSRALWPERALRSYQEEVARAIVASVEGGWGRQFAVVFARQAGKDELLAQMIAYLLNLRRAQGGSIVVAAPTFRPQSLVARSRLLERLDNGLNRRVGHPAVQTGYVVSVGRASARYLSAGPTANVRGETASLLLVCNEAQDVDPDRWDAAFDPMAASTNATTVFSGTVWSDRTLLARQMRHLRALERADGAKRVFTVPWTRVATDLPAYGERVRARIAQVGRDHPFIRTEYELQEIAGAGGLFGAARRAQLQGDHPRQRRATPGRRYALLIDVAGEDDDLAELPDGGLVAHGGRRDSTALTVVEIVSDSRGAPAGGTHRDRVPARRVGAMGGGSGRGQSDGTIDAHSIAEPPNYPTDRPATARFPSYRVVDRRVWTGARHTALHATIVDLARNIWRVRRVVVDATGIGAGLASWLAAALPGLVVPWIFTAHSKSDLGWRLLAAIDSGRLKEYADDGADDTRLFWRQVEACGYEVRPGPGKLLAWGVEEARTHDDLLLSLALVGALDDEDFRPRVARGMAGEGG